MAKVTSMAGLVVSLMAGIILFWIPAATWANAQCWLASADSGRFEFSGTTEGRSFDGVFESFQVKLCLQGQDLATAAIEVTVETSSANTQSRDRDQTLKGEEFFWVSQFPEAVWISQSIEPISDEFTHRAIGELALRDVRLTQPVEMSLLTTDQGPRLVGQASMLRLDYNVGIGEFEDTDFIGNEVSLTFDLGLVPDA